MCWCDPLLHISTIHARKWCLNNKVKTRYRPIQCYPLQSKKKKYLGDNLDTAVCRWQYTSSALVTSNSANDEFFLEGITEAWPKR